MTSLRRVRSARSPAFAAPVSVGHGSAFRTGRVCASTTSTTTWSIPALRVGRKSRFELVSKLESSSKEVGKLVSKLETSSPKELGKLEVRRIGILATATPATTTTEEASAGGGGFLGVKAKAYWKSMGFLPLFFAGFGIFALLVKMLKVVQGKWTSSDGVNRAMVNESVITTKEQEADLHVFKCGGCGYEIYPARGREFKFFPENFKCPLCGSPKSSFWDLNDPTHPNNQEDLDDLQPVGMDLNPAGDDNNNNNSQGKGQ